MAIPRPDDPYGLTAPPAWPEVDEDLLAAQAESFHRVSMAVGDRVEDLKQERTQLFSGIGIWSGAAAGAAKVAFDARVAELEQVKERMTAAAKLFSDSAIATVTAKNEIRSNVETANKILDWIRTHKDIPDEAKTQAIAEGIAAVRNENIAIVAGAAVQITNKPRAPAKQSSEQPDDTPEPRTTAPVVPASNFADPNGFLESPGRAAAEPPPRHIAAPNSSTGAVGQDYGESPERAGSPASSEPAESATANASEGYAESPQPADGGFGDNSMLAPTPSIHGIPGAPGTPAAPTPPRVSAPVSPMSSGGSAGPTAPSTPTSPSAPSTGHPAATVPTQTPVTDLQRTMAESATKAVVQGPIPSPPTAPMTAAPAVQPSSLAPIADIPSSSPPTQTPSAAGTPAGQAPVATPIATGAAPAPAVPLGPPTTPTPAAPVAPPVNVGTAAASTAGPGASAVGAPAPVPVSAARAQREAIAAATRRPSGSDPTQLAQRVAAALNVDKTDMGFSWVTGLTKDGMIVVANNYGLGYIPDGVKLPDRVKMDTADEGIPAHVRGSWATYPILALHGWAQHHNTDLRAVIATEDQFKGFDPGAPRITLRPDDVPANGHMEGRPRLQVISPAAASKLAAVTPAGLSEVLPPPPTDATPPEDRRALLWFEVFRPLLSNAPDRGRVQMLCFVDYADHAQDLALHRAHTATDAVDQRAAIADWVYWQHLSVLMQDAISTAATV